MGVKPITQIEKRFVCLSTHNLDLKQLHECDWLLDLFGKPSTFVIDKVRLQTTPPTDKPVVIVQRPHIEAATAMLEKWSEYGAKFSILHLSDEHLTDNISMYDLEGCEKVLRFYQRPGMSAKVTTIPLGYHWTLAEGSQNMMVKTPRLPFRSLTWSFYGTDWNGRSEQLKPLPEGKAIFYKDWNDPSALSKAEYIQTLLDTVFVPCPDGMNPETFRFYEALECGCVPLLIRTERNAAWVDWVSEHLQILPLSSWAEAAKLVEHLMREKPMLEAYRGKILGAWMAWRETLRGEIKEWLE